MGDGKCSVLQYTGTDGKTRNSLKRSFVIKKRPVRRTVMSASFF
jgi:hypothetical protein